MARATCSGCGLRFSQTKTFDAHRVGQYELRDAKGRVVRPNTRRCLAPADLRQRDGAPLLEFVDPGKGAGFWRFHSSTRTPHPYAAEEAAE